MENNQKQYGNETAFFQKEFSSRDSLRLAHIFGCDGERKNVMIKAKILIFFLLPFYLFSNNNEIEKKEFTYASFVQICSNLNEDYKTITEFEIPYGYTSITSNAFYDCHSWSSSTLKSIKIPDTVVIISAEAFSSCTKLEELFIPSSVKSIGISAFSDCYSLTEINVSEENTKYSSKNGILYNKRQTTILKCPQGKTGTVELPTTVISIGEKSFYSCKKITEIILPYSISSIGHQAFYNCIQLINLTIPSDIIAIGKESFYNCKSLKEITIPNGVREISDKAFYGCSGLSDLRIENGVSVIGNNAFTNCSSLESIVIPETISSIGAWAFQGCSNLESVTIKSERPPFISVKAFTYDVLGFKIYVPQYSFYSYKAESSWYNYINYIEPMR